MTIVTKIVIAAVVCYVTGASAQTFGEVAHPEVYEEVAHPEVRDLVTHMQAPEGREDAIGAQPPPTIHPDDILIEICKESMELCVWSLEELVEKIEERMPLSTEEYPGTGEPVGPAVDPELIAKERYGKEPLRPGRPEQANRGGIPRKCVPFGEKYARTRKYRIRCTRYLYDGTLKYYKQRRKAMMGCFLCRQICEKAGAISYI